MDDEIITTCPLEFIIETRNVFHVDPLRLASGDLVNDDWLGRGDINASYSGDRIGERKPIRRPFEWQGSLWVCVGMVLPGRDTNKPIEATAYRLIPKRFFGGKSIDYAERTATEDLCAAARNDSMGFYHGVAVKRGKEEFILCGPPALFVQAKHNTASSSSSASQLTLF